MSECVTVRNVNSLASCVLLVFERNKFWVGFVQSSCDMCGSHYMHFVCRADQTCTPFLDRKMEMRWILGHDLFFSSQGSFHLVVLCSFLLECLPVYLPACLFICLPVRPTLFIQFLTRQLISCPSESPDCSVPCIGWEAATGTAPEARQEKNRRHRSHAQGTFPLPEICFVECTLRSRPLLLESAEHFRS